MPMVTPVLKGRQFLGGGTVGQCTQLFAVEPRREAGPEGQRRTWPTGWGHRGFDPRRGAARGGAT
ncbi:hypothetical protein BN381_150087 [Candidatus Microthrix parvicella RN1]|uniref:Uncharacterized protein n=1 Tax=Candidatus Neomicrothrix parvicella RN1 TaxID=1229780 RepID=R4YX91_9ACTN|nr:hypothetical protein BN381_150087 [Candidatus Microthrix parvicella RN1]